METVSTSANGLLAVVEAATDVVGKQQKAVYSQGDIARTLYDIYTALVGFFVNVFKSSQISAREDAIACVCNLTEENTENMKKYLWG